MTCNWMGYGLFQAQEGRRSLKRVYMLTSSPMMRKSRALALFDECFDKIAPGSMGKPLSRWDKQLQND